MKHKNKKKNQGTFDVLYDPIIYQWSHLSPSFYHYLSNLIEFVLFLYTVNPAVIIQAVFYHTLRLYERISSVKILRLN